MKKKLHIILFIIFNIIFAGLIKPENNSILNYTHILFEWEQLSGADSYQIQISSDENFSNIIIDTIDSSLKYIEKNNINWSNDYYWRIRPIYNNNPIDVWSDYFSFETNSQISNASSQIYLDNQSKEEE